MHKVSGTLEVTPPFNLSLSARFLENFTPTAGEQEIIDGTITRALMIRGQVILFNVRQPSADDNGPVKYDLMSMMPLAKPVRQIASDTVSFFLSLQDDINPFYQIAQKDDRKFYEVIERFRGFHHVKFLTPLETAAWAILTQRIPMAAAKKMRQRLIETVGGSIEIDGKTFWAFPDYSRVKNISVKDLNEITKNPRKAEFLHSLFKAWSSIDEAAMLKMDLEEAKVILKDINGIGEWSATFTLSRGFGRMEQLPGNLDMIMSEISRMYGPDVSIEKIDAIYGKWVGYWLLYVWMAHLDREKAARHSILNVI